MRTIMALIGALSIAGGSAALPPPEQLLELKMKTQMLTQTTGTITGEGVCWHASWRAGDFVSDARQTGDLAYLEAGIAYFDALIAKLHTSPDGYRGWVGPYIYDESVYGDVHVGDAILVNHMLALAEFVGTELPEEQRQRFAPKAREYIDLAEHICAKWQARGTWIEDGHYGGYVAWNRFLLPDQLDAFQERADIRNSALSLPFNKQQSMGIVHLRLHRLTGDPEHRRKAILIFSYAKSRLSRFDDHYTWSYWEPFYPHDVQSTDPAELKHWVGTHPYRDYQAGEVGEFVEAYHSGIVFDKQDMQHLVRTNLRMWNGDRDEPKWANSDVAANQTAVPGFERTVPEGDHFTRLAGTLWRSLAEFDPTLAELAGTTAANTAFARRYDLPVAELAWPIPRVTYLNMACVLPAAVDPGATAYLISKSRAPGALRILLTDASGEREREELFSGQTPGGLDGREGLLIREWTADVDPGPYRVRWVYGDEHRDYLITVKD